MGDNIIYGLGDKLKHLREKHDLTQQEVANRLNVDRKTISRYERDEVTPSIERIIKLAVMFNTSIDYLLGVGKESFLYLYDFNENQRAFILKTINELKENFPNKEKGD